MKHVERCLYLELGDEGGQGCLTEASACSKSHTSTQGGWTHSTPNKANTILWSIKVVKIEQFLKTRKFSPFGTISNICSYLTDKSVQMDKNMLKKLYVVSIFAMGWHNLECDWQYVCIHTKKRKENVSFVGNAATLRRDGWKVYVQHKVVLLAERKNFSFVYYINKNIQRA